MASCDSSDENVVVFTNHRPEDLVFHTVVTSPFSQKVHMYLLYKQVPFTIKYVHPRRLVKCAVPMLEVPGKDGGTRRFLSESSELGIWLEDNFPDTSPMLPSHIREEQIALEARMTEMLIPPIFQNMQPHIPRSGSLWSRIATIGQQVKNCCRMAKAVDDTTPGGIGVLRYMWPFIMATAPHVWMIVSQVLRDTNNNTAEDNIRAGLDGFERELQLARKEFRLTAEHPRLEQDDVVFLSRSLTNPGMADLTAYAAITSGYRLGISGTDAFRKRPAVMWWVRKMDAVIQEKQRRGVILKDAEAGTEVSYFSPPVIPASLQDDRT